MPPFYRSWTNYFIPSGFQGLWDYWLLQTVKYKLLKKITVNYEQIYSYKHELLSSYFKLLCAFLERYGLNWLNSHDKYVYGTASTVLNRQLSYMCFQIVWDQKWNNEKLYQVLKVVQSMGTQYM